MFSIEEAQQRILNLVSPLQETERISIKEALGRVLAEEIYAPFDVPPLANSAMDGYAVRSEDTISATDQDAVVLKVVAEVPAGSYYTGRIGPGEAARILTGAPLPAGVDAVIPQEKVKRKGEYIHFTMPLSRGRNVRPQGEDIQKGEKVLEKGTQIRPQEMGVLSSLGFTTLSVIRQPRVALLSTGNEIVEPGTERALGQIYDSNRFSLMGLLQAMHIIPIDLGIAPDRKEDLRARLLEGSAQADAVLTSGGVSVGSYDLMYDVLLEIGQVEAWKVKVKPGKPQAYGKIGKAFFFGLPGNPVSSVVVFLLFVRPALQKIMGLRAPIPQRFQAILTAPIRKEKGRTEFQRGILEYVDHTWRVANTGAQGSGILHSLLRANCFIILEEGREFFEVGEAVWVEPFTF